MNNTTTVEISPRTIIRTILIILAFVVAWNVRSILVSFLAAFILMTGFAQIADWLHANGVNKSISALLAYMFLLAFLSLVVFLVIPPLLVQIKIFINNFPYYLIKLQEISANSGFPLMDNQHLSNLLTSKLGAGVDSMIGFLLNTINGVLNFLTVAVLSFYLLLERDKFKNNLFIFFPHLPKTRVTGLAHKIENKVGSWVRGELLLMLIVGSMCFVGLTLLRVEYALPLAIIAGLLEAVPLVGPVVSAVPAVLVALVTNPISAIGVVLLYVIVQQFENNLIVPKVMGTAVGMSPLVVILSLFIGASLFGIAGALLAVPTAAMIQVIVSDFLEHRDISQSRSEGEDYEKSQ